MVAVRVFFVGAVAAVAATVFMARKDPTDHYAALGVDRRATKDEIRAAYKQAALKFHPDKCASKRGLWHALLGGAARCARRRRAPRREVLDDAAIEYDVELARIEFERTPGASEPRPRRRRPPRPPFRPRRVLPLRGLPLPHNLDVRGGTRPARRQARRRADK